MGFNKDTPICILSQQPVSWKYKPGSNIANPCEPYITPRKSWESFVNLMVMLWMQKFRYTLKLHVMQKKYLHRLMHQMWLSFFNEIRARKYPQKQFDYTVFLKGHIDGNKGQFAWYWFDVWSGVFLCYCAITRATDNANDNNVDDDAPTLWWRIFIIPQGDNVHDYNSLQMIILMIHLWSWKYL